MKGLSDKARLVLMATVAQGKRAEAWGEDDQRLETLRDEGWTNEEIARELGRNASAVEKRVSFLGLKVNPGRKRERRTLVPTALGLLVDEAEVRRALVAGKTATACERTVEVPGRSYCHEHAAICYGCGGRKQEEASTQRLRAVTRPSPSHR